VLELLGAGENIIFVMALVLMVMIGIVEAVGLGSAALGHDVDIDGDGDWLSWLGVGRLPLLMLLVVFLASFASIGLIGQQIAHDVIGHFFPSLIAAPAAGVAAIPVTSAIANILARIMPKDETTAIGIDQLVGLHAEIIVGRATQGSPAKARVRDFHGQVHFVMAEPDNPESSFVEGDEILLVRRENHVFRAIISDRPAFSNWIER
jgi:hypothetical protein